MAKLIKVLVSVSELDPPPADAFEENPANFGYIDGQIVFVDFDEGTWSPT